MTFHEMIYRLVRHGSYAKRATWLNKRISINTSSETDFIEVEYRNSNQSRPYLATWDDQRATDWETF